MAEQPTPEQAPPHVSRRWLDVRATLEVLRMPEVGLLVLTFFLATFAFANFEGTLSLLNQSLGLGDDANFLVFAGVGFSLMLCQGLIYRRLTKRWPERRFVLVGLVLMAVGLACLGGVAAAGSQPVQTQQKSVVVGLVLGLLFSTFSAMQFVFAPIWGRISDRVGRRPILLLGLLGSVVFYALFGVGSEVGLLPDLAMFGLVILFLARAGQGFAGATIATAQAAIADSTTSQERSRGMALIGVAFGIGFTVGPLVGAAMIKLFPELLGGPCFAAAALSLVALLIGWRQLPETLPTKAGPLTPETGKAALRMVFVVVVIDLLGFGLVLPILPRIGERFLGAEMPPPREMAAVSVEAVGLWAGLALGMFVAVMGFSFLTPSLQSLISKRADPARQGEVLGVNQSGSALARILGPVVGLVLLKVGPLPFWPYAVAAVLLVSLVLPATRIRRE